MLSEPQLCLSLRSKFPLSHPHSQLKLDFAGCYQKGLGRRPEHPSLPGRGSDEKPVGGLRGQAGPQNLHPKETQHSAPQTLPVTEFTEVPSTP